MHLASEGTFLPEYVEQEFEANLKCGRLRARYSAGTLRNLSCRAAGSVQLLSDLRFPAHGRDCDAAGYSGTSGALSLPECIAAPLVLAPHSRARSSNCCVGTSVGGNLVKTLSLTRNGDVRYQHQAASR